MKSMNKKMLKTIIIISLLVVVIILFLSLPKRNSKYKIESPISDLNIVKDKNNYLEYLKQFVKPQKLQKFIDNGYINLSLYKKRQQVPI